MVYSAVIEQDVELLVAYCAAQTFKETDELCSVKAVLLDFECEKPVTSTHSSTNRETGLLACSVLNEDVVVLLGPSAHLEGASSESRLVDEDEVPAPLNDLLNVLVQLNYLLLKLTHALGLALRNSSDDDRFLLDAQVAVELS